ncbi:MAG: hypothetical protein PSN46_08840 [Gammaproteobacteria bacterium]|nr:hypothetical protein [Gammaproteobacteria bacterium]
MALLRYANLGTHRPDILLSKAVSGLGAYSRTFGHLVQQHPATCSMNIRPPSPGAFSQAVEA